jgi:hypothetical protein
MYKRPIHCIDMKHKRMCIKNENKWIHDAQKVQDTLCETNTIIQKKYIESIIEKIQEYQNIFDKFNKKIFVEKLKEKIIKSLNKIKNKIIAILAEQETTKINWENLKLDMENGFFRYIDNGLDEFLPYENMQFMTTYGYIDKYGTKRVGQTFHRYIGGDVDWRDHPLPGKAWYDNPPEVKKDNASLEMACKIPIYIEFKNSTASKPFFLATVAICFFHSIDSSPMLISPFLISNFNGFINRLNILIEKPVQLYYIYLIVKPLYLFFQFLWI